MSVTQTMIRVSWETVTPAEEKSRWKDLLPAHTGWDSCPRLAALMHTPNALVNRKGRMGSINMS